MKSKKAWGFAALFVIALVLTIPFYSANVLATSIQITRNSGETAIEGSIDATGDIWTVEALVSGTNEDVTNEKVKVSMGVNSVSFNSCENTANGALCQYVSPLQDGIPAGSYDFAVQFEALRQEGSAARRGMIVADGNPPVIEKLIAVQDGDNVKIDFSVTEDSVGLKQIEIIEMDSGEVLQTIVIEEGSKKFNYLADTDFDGKLQATLTGEGFRKLGIKAEDLLGHKSPVKIVSFRSDFIKPIIKSESMNFTGFGKFLGQFIGTTDINIDIVDNNFDKVVATSEQAVFPSDLGECSLDEEVRGLFHCAWRNVQVTPGESVSINFVASDRMGNVIQADVVKSDWVHDTSNPELVYFGSTRTYGGRSFVKNGDNRIVLIAREQGAGIAIDGIRANLQTVGGSPNHSPTQCEDTDEGITCYWDVSQTSFASDSARIGLVKFEDKVGNQGELPQLDLVVDNSGPTVTSLEILGTSDSGDKEYFQSNDMIKFVFEAKEVHGLHLLANLNGIVNDAETKYPENDITMGLGDGWMVFTEESCTPGQGNWTCSLLTDPIRSGYSSSVPLQIKIQDTAGNDAQAKEAWLIKPESMRVGTSGQYSFELLALSTEENPDYWEVPKEGVRPFAEFIDMDTTPYISSRMAFDVVLRSTAGAKVKKVELIGCESDFTSEDIGRQVIWGNTYPDGQQSPAKFDLLLEFPPFDSAAYFKSKMNDTTDFKQANLEHLCRVRIFSQVGNEAVRAAEVQEFVVNVPFAFSEMGALDENMQNKIDDLKDGVSTGFWGTIATMESAFQWIKRILDLVQLVLDIVIVWDLADIALGSGTTAQEDSPYVGQATVASMTAYCLGGNLGKKGVSEIFDYFQVPLQILTCKKIECPSGQCTDETFVSVAEFYNDYVQGVLNLYNAYVDKYARGWVDTAITGGAEGFEEGSVIPRASNVYENIYLSSMALCIPGIVHNLDKYRQIECKYISCLEDDVPAGKATVNACGELREVMVCKYYTGPLVQLLPITGMWDSIVRGVQSLITDPFALISSAVILGCAVDCLTPPAGGRLQLSSGCVQAHFAIKLLGLFESMFAAYDDWSNFLDQGLPNYCSQVIDE